MRVLSFLVSLFFVTNHLSAAVVVSRPPSPGGGGYLSGRYGADGSGFDEFVWDSFSVATTQTLREIHWRGTRTGAAPVGFEISINTVALPGGTAWHVTGNANETPTGTPGVYDYRFTFPAGFVMTGGQTYWLQVFAVQNEMPDWQWSAGMGGNGTHFAQVPAITGNYSYVTRAGDVAFSLLDAATVPVTIAVNRMPSTGGTVTGGGTFNPGDSVTVTATPANGRTFINWTEDGVVVSANASLTFTADGSKTLTANFTGPNTGPYVIDAVPNPGVYGNVGGAGTFNAGELVDLDVSMQDGFSFVGWTENGAIVSTANPYQFTATQDRNLVANFTNTLNSYLINGTVSPASSGTVVIAGTAGLSSKSFPGGTIITLNATAAPGFHFAYWKQGLGLGDLGGPPRVVGTNPSLIHMVVYNASLIAHFEENFPSLFTTSFPVGGGTTTGGGTYAHGSNVTVNAVPAVGYVFSSWRQGNTVLGTDPGYVHAITNDTVLTADFIATNRSITATAVPAEGGSVTGAGIFGNGASVTLTSTAAPGFYFSGWTLDGLPAGSVNPAVFNVLADHTFEANFNPLPVLSIAPATGRGFSFTWPDTLTGWVLQESPDLSPASWAPSSLPITTSGGQNQVSIPSPTGSLFFRLSKP